MTIRNLHRIFEPRSVAVVGASDQPGKVGYTLLHNLTTLGYTGEVFPINASRPTVQGRQAWKSLDRLPHTPDLAVICTPAATVPSVVEQCGELGIDGVMIISAGFREVGPEGLQLEQQIRQTQLKFPGMRIVGPNCLGLITPHLKLSASFAHGMPEPGRVAFLSQSGALCTAVLDWAIAEGLGFSTFVSLGNMLDVGLDDLLDYLAVDPRTESVILYVESITKAREFMSAARAFAAHKPIVAYKAGRFADSAKAASSHTGALAGVDAVYEAAFQRAGIVRVFDVDEMFDCAELLARCQPPKGPRLGIITNAGGPGVMACDALLARGGVLAELSAESLARLNQVLPPAWSHSNPVDVLGDAPAERYAQALEIVLQDDNIDSVLIILTPQAMTEPTETARAIVAAARGAHKPVLTAWMGREMVREGVQILNEGGIPTFQTPEHAVRAYANLVAYAKRRQVLYETPRDVPLTFTLDRKNLVERAREVLRNGGELLSENDSKLLLELYGIRTTRPVEARSSSQAVALARQIGYPVVLKVLSPQITHKTDVQGVHLNLKDDEEVQRAFEQIVTTARRLRPDADVQGVTVQKMVTAVNSVELILGAKRDPVFGPVIMVGSGGVTAEVFQDTAIELPPLNERLARRMLESLRAWKLLQGYRGRPVVNVDRLIETLMRFSYLIADLPEIQEVDINPLLVSATDTIALDGRVFVRHDEAQQGPRRAWHLAISPYPEEFTRTVQLNDGTPILLRPIKPEDEPAWIDLLNRSSAETLWRRFRYLFKEATHEMASRYCFVDYDREIALAAEVQVDGRSYLIGVGRLVANVDHTDAEYAVLVADAWQGRGLGERLTAACLDVARRWGVQQVFGETAQDNTRMLRLFRTFNFDLQYRDDADVVLARLMLPKETTPAGESN
jgi:acetyltransferase